MSARELTKFSVRYFLPDQVMRRPLSLAIARARGLRLLGAALGLSIPPLLRAASHDELDVGSALLWGAFGYLIGALVAGLLPMAGATEARTAALVPRRARDYIAARAMVWAPCAVALTLIAALAFLVAPRKPFVSNGGTVAGALALSVAAALVTAVGVRWVVARRQPVSDVEAVAVDDALRAHGVHFVVGSGTIIGMLAASAASFAVGIATDVGWLSVAFRILGAAASFIALTLGIAIRTDRWWVRPKIRP